MITEGGVSETMSFPSPAGIVTQLFGACKIHPEIGQWHRAAGPKESGTAATIGMRRNGKACVPFCVPQLKRIAVRECQHAS